MKKNPLMLSIVLGMAFALSRCNYWDNLIETKEVDKETLDGRVVDVWFGNPLENIEIQLDPGTGFIDQTTDSAGKFVFTGIATGDHSLRFFSQESLYLSKDSTWEHMRNSPGEGTVYLIRNPNKWYPGEAEKQIDFSIPETIRFPVSLEVTATPSELKKPLTYVWTFSTLTALNRVTREKKTRFYFNKEMLDALGGRRDTLKLVVEANFGGVPMILGSASRSFLGVENKPPITSLSQLPTPLVGCGDDDFWLNLIINSSDPDGRCETISIKAEFPEFVQGKIDTVLRCSGLNIYKQKLNAAAGFDILDPVLQNKQEEGMIRLTLEVIDNNGEKGGALYDIPIKTNLLPKAEVIFPILNYYRAEKIPFLFRSEKQSSSLTLGYVEWGDGTKEELLHFHSDTITFRDTIIYHAYADTGRYTVKFTQFDKCDGEFTDSALVLVNQINRPPIISIDSIMSEFFTPSDTSLFILKFKVLDADIISMGRDTVKSIFIDWGDNKGLQAIHFPMTLGFVDSVGSMEHSYPTGGQKFVIKVRALDKYDNLGMDSLVITRP